MHVNMLWGFHIPIYFLKFYICMLFYIFLEPENDLGEVETSSSLLSLILTTKSLSNLKSIKITKIPKKNYTYLNRLEDSSVDILHDWESPYHK